MEQQVEQCRKDNSCVRIGVVGHRTNRLTDSDLGALEGRISDTMDALQRIIADQRLNDVALEAEVVTSLAEGADRLLARKAVELGVLEVVVLPFQRSRFERDFHSNESLVEFRELLDAAVSVIEPTGDPRRAEEGYETASSVIIDCADLVIAVWDGKPGRGAGGTADTVDKSLHRGRPVIWVHARRPYAIEVIRPAAIELDPVVETVVEKLAAVMAAGARSEPEQDTAQSTALVR